MTIRHDFTQGQIATLLKAEIALCDDRITELLGQERTFSAFEAYESIIGDLVDRTEAARFMFYVHQDDGIRREAEAAQELLDKFLVDIGPRKDVYAFLKSCDSVAVTPVQRRLADKMLRGFRRAGLDLPDDQLAKVTACYQRLASLDTQFHSNLNDDKTSVLLVGDDVDGVPTSLLERLPKDGDGYRLSMRVSDVIPFMQNAKSSEARRRAAERYDNRAPANTALLAEAIELRKQLVTLLGYPTWADFRTEIKMAGTASAVIEFLVGLRIGLAPKRDQDIALLLEYKNSERPSSKFDPWDVIYCENQIMKKEFALDTEMIKEYFPAEHVMREMLNIFSELLGVRYVKSEAPVWHEGVVLYEVRSADDDLIAHFYADMYPRDGKYNHATAFTLRQGRIVADEYVTPISAIVCNFTPPSAGKPSLLTHDEVVTLFHEFGHIMHQTLTRAPYASISGTSVAYDFVETLSQLFENWAWDHALLKRISKHYTTGLPLPEDVIGRMISTRNFLAGWTYTRQVFLSLYDMELHTSLGPVDPIAVYKRLYKEIMAIDPIEKTQFPAGFGHLLGGYDAGYYGYLWSRVFAQDMFSRFEIEGVLSREAGAALVRVLQAGDTVDASQLLQEYLGREPSNSAFLKLLGIE